MQVGHATMLGAALLAAACGDCPPARYRAAQPEHTTTYKYTVRESGSTWVSHDGAAAFEIDCDACIDAVDDATIGCETACAEAPIQSEDFELDGCEFAEERTVLRCAFLIAAQPASCTCSLLDC